MNEEYLPPEHEQTALVPEEKLIRIRCAGCTKEVGYHGTHEHAMDVLEKLGWRIHQKIFCPDCVKKAVRKWFHDRPEQ